MSDLWRLNKLRKCGLNPNYTHHVSLYHSNKYSSIKAHRNANVSNQAPVNLAPVAIPVKFYWTLNIFSSTLKYVPMIDFIIWEIVCYLAWASAARTFVRVSRQCLKCADPGLGTDHRHSPGYFSRTSSSRNKRGWGDRSAGTIQKC